MPRMHAPSGDTVAGLAWMPDAGNAPHIGGASAPNGDTFHPPIAPNSLAIAAWIA